MRVFSYSRVSNDERSQKERRKNEEAGELNRRIEAQQEEHISYCVSNRLPSPVLYSDICSGSDEKQKDRKSQIDLLSAIHAGDMLVVSKGDRWSRDLVWSVGSIRQLVKKGVTVRATSDAWSDAERDDTVLGIMAWTADQERKRIKDRTWGARKRMLSQGMWILPEVPRGYSVDPNSKHLVPNDDARIIRSIFAWCIAGKSSFAIMRLCREQFPSEGEDRAWGTNGVRRLVNGTKWYPDTVRRILTSRVYLGEVRPQKGAEWVPGCHEPLVSETDFARAREALAGRNIRLGEAGSRTDAFAGRDILTCGECGQRIAIHARDFAYYRCAGRPRKRGEELNRPPCELTPVRVELVDASILSAVAGRVTELRELILRADESGPAPTKPRDFAGELKKLEARKARLVDLAVDGALTPEDFKTRKAKLEGEIASVKVDAESITDAERARAPEGREALSGFLTSIGESLSHASGPELRELARILASEVRLSVEPGERPRSRYYPPRPATSFVWRSEGELLRGRR